jgi:hypothetical protein
MTRDPDNGRNEGGNDIAAWLPNANADAWLVQRGRYLNVTFLLESSQDQYLVGIERGRIHAVEQGPFVMPRWTFALRADAETWARFWEARPAPGFHDLMALIKFRRLRLEGDQHPFMSHLLYFKDLFALGRAARRQGETA